ncbi:MAG: hypothetical protein RLZZ15_999 [Verrucomicrobiota bacterium]|jgi:serine/threonine protein kinase/tetratricopeptide (TPR) repeat protein
MTTEERLFTEALAVPAAARAAFLARACGVDFSLHARLLELIEAHVASENFLAGSLAAQLDPRTEERAGDAIGRYSLVRKIGEGGCGTVFLAEQHVPVRRRVAVKVIKLGMDTRAVVMRFEAERQALAMMDHPDIAHVIEAGATEAGRPFFAMEFVEGTAITKFCDEHQLGLAARLELFARVCLALQHAHQKGIIHRDVKPSNILVATRDGAPAPKVIDFGIAKATQDRLTEHTLVTGVDQFIGTPAYMSPEQADQRGLDIDTRSDVYSLGVLLYELLTGRQPFEARTLQHAGVDEIRRIIREVEPPRPSARVATLSTADRDAAAGLRAAPPAQLAPALRGDLDWVVMRCLEKDRARRYGTAQELADDIRRHLRHEPIVARPPSELYRLEKFFARNRLACVSAAALALSLVAGTVVSVRQAIRATAAERIAKADRDAADLARADSQQRQQQAEQLLSFMLGDLSPELKKFSSVTLRRTLGDKATAYFAAVPPEKLTDTEVARQSKAFTQIGEIRMDEAKYAEAAEAFTNAFKSAAALTARHPRDADMLFERAQAEYWIGAVARRRGDQSTQREWWTRYRDSAVALVALEGRKPRAQLEFISGQHNLALLEAERGNLTTARAGFLAERTDLSELLAQKPNDRELRRIMAELVTWLGLIAERDGDYAAAIGHLSEMVSRYEALAAAEPTIARWRNEVATSLVSLGHVHALLGRIDEASASLAKATALLETLVASDPKNHRWKANAFNARLAQVTLLLAGPGAAAAADQLAELRVGLESLSTAEPTSSAFRRSLAKAWRLEAHLRMASGRTDAGEASARALDLCTALLKETRADDWAVAEFAQASLLAGRLAQRDGDPVRARRHWELLLTTLGDRPAEANDWRFLDPAAQALAFLGRGDEARPLIARLQRLGYRAIDPLAASILNAATPTVSPTQSK